MITRPIKENDILLIDDHPFMQKVVSQLIVSSGFKDVVVVGSGSEALQKLRNTRFKLVITDLEMEPIDGYDIVQSIRTGTEANDRSLPVLVMTPHPEAELVTRCLMFDINGFVLKPVDQKALTKKIVSALARKIRLKTAEEYQQAATNWQNRADHDQRMATMNATKASLSNMQNQTLQSLENAHQFLTTSIPVNEQGLVKATLPIALLGAGMVVAADVKNKDHSILLHAGKELSEKTVEKLNKHKASLRSEVTDVLLDVNRFKLITEVKDD